MNYPDPIGVNPLRRPNPELIEEILQRSAMRFVGDKMFRPYIKRGGSIEILRKAIVKCGGWATAEIIASTTKKKLVSATRSLDRFCREKQLKFRYRDDGVREYGL